MRWGVKCRSLCAMKAARQREEGIITEIVGSLDDGLRRELSAFLGSLGDERNTFVTTYEECLRSEVLILARRGGCIVGLTGIVRRFFHLPFGYYVVKSGQQGRGVAKELLRAKQPYLDRYPLVFGIMMRDARACMNWIRSRKEFFFYHDREYSFAFHTPHRRLGRISALMLKPLMPPVLAAKRAWDRIRGG